MWGDNSKRPAEPQTNLMRVTAASKRRLDNLQDPRGKNDQPFPRMLNSEFVSHKLIMTTSDRKSESVLISGLCDSIAELLDNE